MSTYDRTLSQIMGSRSHSNVRFNRLGQLLLRLGFEERVRGSLPIFRRPDVEERINLPRDGRKAKAYKVRQVNAILLRHGLGYEA